MPTSRTRLALGMTTALATMSSTTPMKLWPWRSGPASSSLTESSERPRETIRTTPIHDSRKVNRPGRGIEARSRGGQPFFVPLDEVQDRVSEEADLASRIGCVMHCRRRKRPQFGANVAVASVLSHSSRTVSATGSVTMGAPPTRLKRRSERCGHALARQVTTR
jgi:hypothetical protein